MASVDEVKELNLDSLPKAAQKEICAGILSMSVELLTKIKVRIEKDDDIKKAITDVCSPEDLEGLMENLDLVFSCITN